LRISGYAAGVAAGYAAGVAAADAAGMYIHIHIYI